MFHLNKQKITVAFVICLFLSATKVLACSCLSLPNENVNDAIQNAVKGSVAVFSGKVVGFEYRKGIPNEFLEPLKRDSGGQFDYETLVVKFQVERWWKGEASTELFLVTDRTKNSDGGTSNSSCDYSFKEGESYLVYAYGKDSELRTNSCARTKLLIKAEEDLKILGEGKEPVEKNDQPNKSLNRSAKQLFSHARHFLLF